MRHTGLSEPNAGLAGCVFRVTPATPAELQKTAIISPKQVRQWLPCRGRSGVTPALRHNGDKRGLARALQRGGAHSLGNYPLTERKRVTLPEILVTPARGVALARKPLPDRHPYRMSGPFARATRCRSGTEMPSRHPASRPYREGHFPGPFRGGGGNRPWRSATNACGKGSG